MCVHLCARMAGLIDAATSGDVDELRRLLAAGADPSAPFDGQLALHVAALGGHVGAVNALLAASAPPDAVDGDGWTALHNAMLCGPQCLETVRALVAAHANVNAMRPDGQAPLHLVHMADNKVDWKVSRGTPADGRSSFFTAAVIQTLADAGAVVNAPSATGSTPLHEAAKNGALACVMALLHAGASPTAVDHDGQTPADVARACGGQTLLRIRGLLVATETNDVNAAGFSIGGRDDLNEAGLSLIGGASSTAAFAAESDDDELLAESESWACALLAVPTSLPPRLYGSGAPDARSRTPESRRQSKGADESAVGGPGAGRAPTCSPLRSANPNANDARASPCLSPGRKRGVSAGGPLAKRSCNTPPPPPVEAFFLGQPAAAAPNDGTAAPTPMLTAGLQERVGAPGRNQASSPRSSPAWVAGHTLARSPRLGPRSM